MLYIHDHDMHEAHSAIANHTINNSSCTLGEKPFIVTADSFQLGPDNSVRLLYMLLQIWRKNVTVL